MKTIIIGLIAFGLGVTINSVMAKNESYSSDAASVVAYGKNGTALVPVLVDSSGVLQTN